MCVLVVEDDALIRGIIAEFLIEEGFPVLVASDGDEAVALIVNPPRRFSVLVTDFHMPGSHHGRDVADHMRALHPHVHIFIVTGRPGALRSVGNAQTTYDVIPKPFELRNLLGRIGHLVEA